MANVKPIKKFIAGNISASIWLNKGPKAYYYGITIQRRYRNQQGTWQSANSFRAYDLPKVKLVIDQVYRYIMLKQMSNKSTKVETDTETEQEDDDMEEELEEDEIEQ